MKQWLAETRRERQQQPLPIVGPEDGDRHLASFHLVRPQPTFHDSGLARDGRQNLGRLVPLRK